MDNYVLSDSKSEFLQKYTHFYPQIELFEVYKF